MNGDKKIGFNRGKLRCFSCHEPSFFARKCPNPDRIEIHGRRMVPLVNNRGASTNNESPNLAVVSQSFD